MKASVLGIDFGTDSVRVVLVDAANGAEAGTSVCAYPRWSDGCYCDPSSSRFRQHPLDYLESMERAVKDCLRQAGPSAANTVKGVSVDTTGSTPIAVDKQGVPLSMHGALAKNPNAMFVLWKDHTSTKEAAEINAHAAKYKPSQFTPHPLPPKGGRSISTDYLQFVGGIYSSEWFWAKLLHVLREDDAVYKACHSWVEHCDWIPFVLTGGKDVLQMKRGVCSAGHKALWAAEFGGLPPEEFFAALDPRLKGFRSKLFDKTFTADQQAGRLTQEWATRLGLSTDVVVGVGAFDAHIFL